MRRVVLFAKRPRPGAVKTRLVPRLGAERALALYRAFLTDQIGFLRSLAADSGVELCLDGPPGPDAALRAQLAAVPVAQQGPGDLGARLRRAFERSWAEGSRATVAIGADSPTLPARLVSEALSRIEGGAAAAVAPADDGGYVLIGLGRPLPALFRDVPWGSPEVLEATRLRARDAGVDLVELGGWYDVDDATGLARLTDELRRPEGRRRAPATARLLLGHGSP